MIVSPQLQPEKAGRGGMWFAETPAWLIRHWLSRFCLEVLATTRLRLVRPYWDVLRHRAPPEALAAIEARRARGSLQLLAGRVLDCHAREDGLHVTLRLRGGTRRVERFGGVVRCLGPALSLEPASAPLLAAMLRAGLAQRDPAGLGIVTLEHVRLIDSTGQPSRQLFAIGQPCRASRWETTSVPEIARDAVALAELFTSEALSFAREVAG